tara:strand:+ start:32982 stop:35222 length:2241 start_codon:yes stop_codon:yes gene_type:complete
MELMLKPITYLFFFFFLVYILLVTLSVNGYLGRYEGPGEVIKSPVPSKILQEKVISQMITKDHLLKQDNKMILFGDFHVHTTYSADAFILSLPMLGGEGTHPPADACNFARFCSSLDFWSINDHSESLTSEDWQETVNSVRQCNEVGSHLGSPDTVAFLGWEWTQEGRFGKEHYGHKNIIFRGIEEDEIPIRPIASTASRLKEVPEFDRYSISALRPTDSRVYDFMRYLNDSNIPICKATTSVRDLPADCKEVASTPGILFDKLNQWNVDSVVIPHGTTWGNYTPDESDWYSQLNDSQHDPNLQILVEIYSGHGNAEEYRDWRSSTVDNNGNLLCPNITAEFLPACRQAGLIIEKRCLDEGESLRECNKRAEEARSNYLNEGMYGASTIFNELSSEWLDANQCKDCFLPAFNHRPKGSVQYMLALRNFNDDDVVEKFKFGFIGSSNSHTARPGTGYKEVNRREMTEAAGPEDATGYLLSFREGEGPYSRSIARNWSSEKVPPGSPESERVSSFYNTGGLIAAHSNGRNRDAIWESIKQKEVYATSGTRILLWFDLLNDPYGEDISMGSDTTMNSNPRFVVKAAGSLKQKPGCPQYSLNALGPEEVERLCKKECYNPSDIRNQITRIEVVRITPQAYKDEPISKLIQDKWKVYQCPKDQQGCIFTFTDNKFEQNKRDVVYYVRAIEEPSEAINSLSLRCDYDRFGNCLKTNICSGSSLETPYQDDCLGDIEERAWSSPIFIDYREDL